MLQCSGPGERGRGERRVGTRNSEEDWPPSVPAALKGIAGMAPPKNGVAAYYYYYYYTTLHYTTLHYTTLHYITLHYTTLHYTTLHYTTLHYTTLHCTTQHNTTQHNTTQHNTTQHNTTRPSQTCAITARKQNKRTPKPTQPVLCTCPRSHLKWIRSPLRYTLEA